MAKQKLIPEPPDTDKTAPKARFVELATRVFRLPKSEIDKREQQWQDARKRQTIAPTD
jgi:hypothetical protein